MTPSHLNCSDVKPYSDGEGWPQPLSSQAVDLILLLGKNPSDQLVYEMLSKDKWQAALGFLKQYEEKLKAKLDRTHSLKLKLEELCNETKS